MSFRAWVILGVITVGLSAAPILVPAFRATDGDPKGEAKFVPERMLEPFPPVKDFPILPAKRAEVIVAPAESVLGVVIEGTARAYPLRMIQAINNEILVDALGGEPIAVTWCDLCQSGIVYARSVGGRALTFRVAGMLWKGNMVMEDLETGSFWSQLTGEAVDGELIGTRLDSFPAVVTSWDAWRAAHPETTVARLEVDAPDASEEHGPKAHAQRFPPELAPDFILGVAGRTEAHAWTLELLRATPVIHDLIDGAPILVRYDVGLESGVAFRRELDGRTLTFRDETGLLVDDQSGSSWNPLTGVAVSGPMAGRMLIPVQATLCYRATWRRFHPRGTILALPAG